MPAQGFVMNKYSWIVALGPLVAMACSNAIVNKGEQAISPDAGNGQQVALPDQAKSSLVYNSDPAVTADTQAAVVKDLNNFGLEVLQSLAPNNQNFAVSPVSGFIALTMTSDGANGTTVDQMKAVL